MLSPVKLFVKKTFQLIPVGICHFLRPWNSQHHDLWSDGESKSQATSSNRGEKNDRARPSAVRVKVNIFTFWALLPSCTISLTIPWHYYKDTRNILQIWFGMFEIHVFIDWQKPRTGFIASVFVHASAKLRVRTPSTPPPPPRLASCKKTRDKKKPSPTRVFATPPNYRRRNQTATLPLFA